MKGRHIKYSAQELAWIKACSDMPRADLRDLFAQVWGRNEVTVDQIKALCQRNGWMTGRTGCFEKGQKPYNTGKKVGSHPGSVATQFKKGHARSGHAVTLYKPVGTERVTKDGYLERKVNDDMPLQKRWRGVHRINWEAEHGPVPDGHRLKCLDGNKLNVAAENWEAIPYALGPRLNGRFGRDYDSAPAELKPLIMATAKLAHAAHEARKGKRHG